MSLILDPATEARIQQEFATGRYRDLDDLIAQGLKLVQAEREDLASRRAELIARLEESIAQGERGEVFTEEQLRARMAARRAAHRRLQAA